MTSDAHLKCDVLLSSARLLLLRRARLFYRDHLPSLSDEEAVMMRVHVHAQSDERDTFLLKPHSLFESVFATQQDLASGTDDALPRNSGDGRMQRPRHLTRHAGKSSGIGHIAIRCHCSFRDAANGGEKFLEVLRVGISVRIQGGGILTDRLR